MPRSQRGGPSPQSRLSSPVDMFPTADEIAARAHDLFVAGGRRLTKVFEYWQQALDELLDLGARRTLRHHEKHR